MDTGYSLGRTPLKLSTVARCHAELWMPEDREMPLKISDPGHLLQYGLRTVFSQL